MKKFNLCFGVEREQYNLHVVNDVEFPDVHTALKEARAYAEDLYMQDPVADVLEIMENLKVDEDTANLLFNLDMIRKTVYHVEETVDNFGVVETFIHRK